MFFARDLNPLLLIEATSRRMITNSQLYGASSSSGEWDFDASMEDAEHVIWQASQSGSEALNRMLSDAVQPRTKRCS